MVVVPEGGGQGVVSEERVPHSWGEFADALGRMLAEALQDVDQVGVGVHAVQPQVTSRLWMIPTRRAPTSVEVNSQFRLPMESERSERSR